MPNAIMPTVLYDVLYMDDGERIPLKEGLTESEADAEIRKAKSIDFFAYKVPAQTEVCLSQGE